MNHAYRSDVGPSPNNDPLYHFRTKATPEERAACSHPDDFRMPVSGDGWLCAKCGADCEAPRMLEADEVAVLPPIDVVARDV